MDIPKHRSGRMSAAALVVAVALAACGGDDSASDETETAAAPSLPRALAEELAQTSDEVADLIEAGDGCAASQRAGELRDRALAAVESGDVPPDLERPLIVAVDRLTTQIVCEPAPEEEDEDDDKENGNGDKDKDKDKGGGNGDEDDAPNGTTETVETTTDGTTETVETTTEAG
jgi:hypothetical protein